jgi:hypothetical protein
MEIRNPLGTRLSMTIGKGKRAATSIHELRSGMLFYIPPGPPGHDSWVVGDAPYVSLHFLGADHYANK